MRQVRRLDGSAFPVEFSNALKAEPNLKIEAAPAQHLHALVHRVCCAVCWRASVGGLGMRLAVSLCEGCWAGLECVRPDSAVRCRCAKTSGRCSDTSLPRCARALHSPTHQRQQAAVLALVQGGCLGGLGGQVHMIDPDVIVGHNFMGFGLDVLLHRMDQCKARCLGGFRALCHCRAEPSRAEPA